MNTTKCTKPQHTKAIQIKTTILIKGVMHLFQRIIKICGFVHVKCLVVRRCFPLKWRHCNSNGNANGNSKNGNTHTHTHFFIMIISATGGCQHHHWYLCSPICPFAWKLLRIKLSKSFITRRPHDIPIDIPILLIAIRFLSWGGYANV